MTPRRVLVVGSYPPVPLPEAQATAAAVGVFAAQGAEVEVLAPRPCAAHHTASFHSWRGAFALARLAPRFDLVVLQIEPGFPVTSGPRLRRGVALFTLGLALRSAKAAEVHVDDLAVVPRRFGGAAAKMLWRAAGRVVVRSEADRDELVDGAGVEPGRVVVRPLAPPEPGGPAGPGKPAPGDSTDEVMRIVAARARAERARVAALTGTRPPIEPLGPATSVFRARAKTASERVLGPRSTAAAARMRRLVRR